MNLLLPLALLLMVAGAAGLFIAAHRMRRR